MAEKNYLLKEGENANEFATRLQSELDDYKKKVLELKTIEAAELEEKACIEDAEKYDKYISQTEYELQKDVTYDGTHYTKREISTMIMYFIGKQESNWEFTLGLYELYKLWKNDVNVLNFRQLDSTLRVLDKCQFNGFKEWKYILAINEYFKSNHEQFTIDTAGTIYLAQRHNAVMEQMELLKTINSKNSKGKDASSQDESGTKI